MQWNLEHSIAIQNGKLLFFLHVMLLRCKSVHQEWFLTAAPRFFPIFFFFFFRGGLEMRQKGWIYEQPKNLHHMHEPDQ